MLFKKNLFLLMLFILLSGCEFGPIVQPEKSARFVFVEINQNSIGKVIKGDSTLLPELQLSNPNYAYTFNTETRKLSYIKDVEINMDETLHLLVIRELSIESPNLNGSQTLFFPAYGGNTVQIGSVIQVSHEGQAEKVDAWITGLEMVSLANDSSLSSFFQTETYYVASDSDTVVVGYDHNVKITNHGYITSDQVSWTTP